jgi:hypothetical protein
VPPGGTLNRDQQVSAGFSRFQQEGVM